MDNGHSVALTAGEWVDLRDQNGRLQARYHPGLKLLIIQDKKVRTPHDLRRYETGDRQQSTPVLLSA